MSNKPTTYQVDWNGKTIGQRKSHRVYTHAVVIYGFEPETYRAHAARRWRETWRLYYERLWNENWRVARGERIGHYLTTEEAQRALAAKGTLAEYLEDNYQAHLREAEEYIEREAGREASVVSYHHSAALANKAAGSKQTAHRAIAFKVAIQPVVVRA